MNKLNNSFVFIITSFCLFFGSSLSGATAFSVSQQNSDIIRTLDRPEFLWAPSSREVFFTFAQLNNRLWEPDYRVDELKTTKERLNRFIKKIHSEMQARGSRAPLPQVEIISSSDATAFITSLKVCIDVDTKIVHLSPPAINVEVESLAVHDNGVTIARPPVHRGGPTCTSVSWSKAQNLKAIVEHINSRGYPCQLELEKGSVKVTPSNTCKVGRVYDSSTKTFKDVTSTKKLVIDSTSNVIVVTTAFLGKFAAEKQLLSTLAHELGHYYQGHPVFKSKNNFWYSQTTPPQKKYDVHASNSVFTDDLKKVFSQTLDPTSDQLPSLHPIMAAFILKVYPDLIGQSCSDGNGGFDCSENCKVMSDKFQKKSALWLAGGSLGFNRLTTTQWSEIEAFSGQLNSCAQSIKLQHEDVMDPATGEPIFSKLKSGYVPVQFLQSNLSTFLPNRLVSIPASASNMAEVIDITNKIGNEIELERDQWIEKINSERLAYRTVEVEADETSLLLSAFGGIGVEYGIESHLAFLKTNSPEYNYCKSLYDNNFIENGSTTFVNQGMGILYFPHPDHCFRAFYLHQQSLAHSFPSKKEWVGMADQDWAKMVGLAQEISAEHKDIPVPQFSPVKGIPVDSQSPVTPTDSMIAE